MIILPQPVLYVPSGGGGTPTDSFTASDGDLDGNGWTRVGFASGLQIESNQLLCEANGAADCCEFDTSPPDDDYYIEVTFVSQVNTATSVGGFILRGAGTLPGAQDGYFMKVTNGTVELFRSDAGTETSLITGAALSDGDTIRTEVSGTGLELFINGSSQGTATDATYSTGTTRVLAFQGDATSNVIFDDLYQVAM